MGSISPRVSGFWTSTMNRPGYTSMHDDDDVQVTDEFVEDSEYDGRTPLDKTIDRIGMGPCFMTAPSLMLTLVLLQGAISGHSCRYVDSVSTHFALTDPMSS